MCVLVGSAQKSRWERCLFGDHIRIVTEKGEPFVTEKGGKGYKGGHEARFCSQSHGLGTYYRVPSPAFTVQPLDKSH